MDIATTIMLVDLVVGGISPKMPDRPSITQGPRVTIGMSKESVLRAIGGPYETGYSMYAGVVWRYRGDVCAGGTCQVWFGGDETAVTALKGF